MPQAYQSLMISAEQFALSRNILGVHHPLDAIGGRMLAYYTMTQLMAGTYTARLIVERLSVTTFQRLLDGVMILSGTALLWAAIR